MRLVNRYFPLLVLILGLLSCNSSPEPAQAVATPAEKVARAVPVGMTRAAFASHDGVNISYLAGGDGPAVVLLHDFMGEALDWTETGLFNELHNQGYRIVIPDLRGNGQSDHPTNAAGYAAAASPGTFLPSWTTSRWIRWLP